MESLERKIFNKSKRVVIKVGSALIIGDNSKLVNKKIISSLVLEIKKLHELNKEVLLVSSGA